ncbi:YceG family protein [Bacillus tianshenii]|nr:YceG family protein [Bacillus tianshenii]
MNYRILKPRLLAAENGKWREQIKKPIQERPHYQISEDCFEFGQVAVRILGVPHDETEYLHELYELSCSDNVCVLSEELDKKIEQKTFQAIQNIILINQKEKGLSVNRFVAFMEGEQLIPKSSNLAFNRRLREAFMDVLRLFHKTHPGGFQDSDFRRVFVDLIKWSWNHLNKWMQEDEIENGFKTVLWYGEANKSQRYFLYYLILLGFDVLMFHPEGTDTLKELDPQAEYSAVFQFPSTMSVKPFPTERPERKGTVAYRASKEIEQVIHHDHSQIYKPWQFRHYTPASVTLKTTYDELFMIAKERAFIRPNFSLENQTVHIPALFAKVAGVSNNKREYWERLQTLTEQKMTLLIRQFPFTRESNANQIFHYQRALTKNDILDPEKMQTANWWQFHFLPDGLQKGIASAISRVCATPKLIPKESERPEDISLYLFTQLMNLPKEVLTILQQFDYAQEVPKVVLYNYEHNGILSRSDAALLLFLNEIGVDIIVYNPPGHQDIELYIEQENYDIHWLEDVAFEQEFKEPTFIKRFLNNIFPL